MNISKYFIIIALHLLMAGCRNNGIVTEKDLSVKEKNDIIGLTIRYSAKLPPRADHDNKSDKSFDSYYETAAKEYELLYYHHAAGEITYFFFSREAKSITPMKEGIGGTLRIDSLGKLTEYNELFRMWKMPEDTLKKRGRFLFDRMVNGEDLTKYYSKFQGDKYIEFPDDRFVYDKEKRKWIDKVLDAEFQK